ncbi:LysR family transcriptional regulator [Kerstersia similis]|uniref:LysR family transcriptional regulator n=1 Tax=Kerstersia similis TaxID=206505 RepID=UPI0039F0A3B5
MMRQFDDVMIGSLELFCLAAELESFTLAATQAGLTPAAVSRAIGRLEDRLQVKLFVRSTRKIRLTDGGRAYFAHCKQVLNQLLEAERELTGRQTEPAGIVRISVPTTLGHYGLLGLLPGFRKRYPQVKIEVQLSNRNIDLTADGFDIAVRARTPPDSGMIARKLMDAALVVVATPEYLAQAGTPMTLEDLTQHECIQFVLPSTGQRVPWEFCRAGEDLDVVTDGSYTCSDDLLGVVTLARAGAGLLQTYRFIVDEDIQCGRLVELLQPFAGRSRPFSLIYPGNRHMPLRVRVFIDYILACLGDRPLRGR